MDGSREERQYAWNMLRNMNLHDLASKFQAEAITGSVLLALTPTELKEELGISLTTALDANKRQQQLEVFAHLDRISHRHADGPFRAGSPVPRPLGHRLRRSSGRVCVGGRTLGHVAASWSFRILRRDLPELRLRRPDGGTRVLSSLR